jgi:hypothetical protein
MYGLFLHKYPINVVYNLLSNAGDNYDFDYDCINDKEGGSITINEFKDIFDLIDCDYVDYDNVEIKGGNLFNGYEIQNQIYQNLWIRIEKHFNSHLKFEDHIKALTKSQEEEAYDIYRDFVNFIEPLVENSNNHVEFMKFYLKNFFQ